jgi:prepilin peptidase CpaA
VTQPQLVIALLLSISLVASVTDARTGLIPNWLTLSALLLGPSIAAAYGGIPGIALSLLGIMIAGGCAFTVYRLGGLGGGDVKLFAALAGVSGPRMGLEIELFALCCALLCGVTQRLRSKQLLAGQRALARLQQHELGFVRLGGAIFAGTLIALARQLL